MPHPAMNLGPSSLNPFPTDGSVLSLGWGHGHISVAGSAVVGSRKAGWTAATGTAARAAFDTTSVTLPQLAERVKALTDDLRSHGLIGT